MISHLPTLSLSHGAPSLAIDPGPAHDFIAGLAAGLPRPRAILVASAHWLTRAPAVDGSAHPRTIHDFGGFGAELAALDYPAPGSPEIAAQVRDLLTDAGMAAQVVQRGLDHGAWVPLLLAYPAADIPVLQIALQPAAGDAHHLRLGRALAPLREAGVLVIGSGSATHNLGEISHRDHAPPWVIAFDDWLCAAVESGDEAALMDWRVRAPHATRNHPSDDHFLPLLVAFGAAGPGARGTVLHRSVTHGVLAMSSFSFA